jgi:hypothetical protein
LYRYAEACHFLSASHTAEEAAEKTVSAVKGEKIPRLSFADLLRDLHRDLRQC